MHDDRGIDPVTLATTIAAARVAFGAALVLAPNGIGRAWIGDAASSRGASLALRAVGVRDIALGMGALMARRRGTGLRSWVEAGAVTDALDCIISAAALSTLPPLGRVAVILSTSHAAAAGLYAARGLKGAAGETR